MFPIRKRYRKEVTDKNWKIIATLSYSQATIYERYEFVESTNQTNVLIEFIKDNIKFNIEHGHDIVINSLLNEDFVHELMNTRYKSHDSIFKSSWGRKSIEQANFVFVAKELSIDPHDLLHEYTMEEYGWYLDGLIWNLNEQSNDGKLINDRSRLANDKDRDAKVNKFKKMGELLDEMDK